jgi:hypothetical protein
VRYGDAEAAATTLASSVPGATLEKDPSLGGAVFLILGPDFKGGITAPKAGGAAPPTGSGQTTAAPLPRDLATVNAGDTTCAYN